MKIGIVTLPFHINYGGILQAYALSKVLQKEGHEVMFIKEDRGFFKWLRNAIGLQIRKVHCRIKGQRLNIFDDSSKHKEINRFIKRVLPQTSNKKESFDAVIVGSDQVWRKWSPEWNISHYFLDFLKDNRVKRISYAASLGSDKWTMNNDESRLLSELIKGFCGVSVRESDAVAICRENLKITPEVVLDPTLLLSKKDYSIIGASEEKGDYAVSFILDNNDFKRAVSSKVGEIINNRIVALGPEMQDGLKEGKGLIGIEEWIRMYSRSVFVITDSFHGSAFAINFNIPFVVLSNASRGQSRLISILETFNLSDRLITDLAQVESVVANQIAWEDVNEVLNRLRISSISFLNKSLR